MAAFLQSLAKVIQRHRLILRGSIVIVGVSGGMDSLALLHALHQLSASLDYRLHAATLNHQLRGEAGADDARYVEQTATSWGIPVTSAAADVKALAERRNIGVEAAARLARYTFLASVAQQVGAKRIAVAHHADDQAETVLMHILRGSGTQGLGGMTFISPLPINTDFLVIRPFLHFTRAEIAAYGEENGLQPRHDATNDDPSYLRNRIRLEVLPYLQTINPQIRRALTQLADITTAERRMFEERFELEISDHFAQVSNGQVRMNRSIFQTGIAPAFQRRFITWAAEKLAGPEIEIGFSHVMAAIEMALSGRVGSQALLPNGLHLRVDYENIVIEQGEILLVTNSPLLREGEEINIAIPGVVSIPGTRWELQVWSDSRGLPIGLPVGKPVKGNFEAQLAIPESSSVILRTRRPGDRFAPLGLHGHTQKLHKWMIDHKLAAALRDRVPVLEVDGQVAAFLTPDGWIIDDHFAVRIETTQIVYLIFRQIG
jgi:tRNA(Ile)-lysidine synthase